MTDSRVAGGELRAGGTSLPGGTLLVTLHVLAGTLFFSYGIDALIAAWSTPEYSHGPIIPLLSAYMFLREMKSVPPTVGPVRGRWVGVAVVLAAIAIGLLGLLVRIPDIVTYGMILWIGGTVLTLFGARRGWYFWPAVLHLVFMLPLPQFIYWPVSIWLQMVSSQIGVDIIRWFGVPVYLDGNVIDLGVYRLQVAEACSGLRYLFPVMSFSYVFGVLYTGPVWHKIVLLLSAAPITVLMNSVRIGVIGVMVDNFGISYAEGFLHAFEGWVIFIACVGILFALAALMQRMQKEPKPLSESIDMDFDGLGGQLRRFTSIPASAALGSIAAVTLAMALVWHLSPTREFVVPERTPLTEFPDRFEGWRGTERSISPQIARVLRADDYLAMDYLDMRTGAEVSFWVAYYDKLTEGSGIHSPEVCIPAGGWEVNTWRGDTITLGSEAGAMAGAQVPVNRAIIRKGIHRQLVFYWFQQAGKRITSDYVAKFYTITNSLLRGRTDGALVRFMTPIRPGENELVAERRLREMMSRTLPALGSHVPD